jgi:two-component system, OmpR family, response regulator VicR
MKKVLVVDDDPSLAELISEFFRLSGYDVRAVTDSLAAFDEILRWQPNLVTLDIEMPGVDGIELLRQLQSRPETRRIPVVVVSVVAKGALEEGLLQGAQRVFEKPLRFQRLLEEVDALLSRQPVAAGSVALEPYSKVPA